MLISPLAFYSQKSSLRLIKLRELGKEILERLKSLDEVELCDILGISSEDIVERFIDVIEEKIEALELTVDWD